MKNALPYILAITIAAITPVAAAEDGVNTLGIGASFCKEITQLYRSASTTAETKNIDLAVESWSAGFMTSVNYARHLNHVDTKNLGALPLTDQVIEIRLYCKHNPKDIMQDAVVDLMDRMPSNDDAPADQSSF